MPTNKSRVPPEQITFIAARGGALHKTCGAKLRSNHAKFCRSPMIFANGRCRWHGGRTTGPKVHKQAAMTYGIYGSTFTTEDKAFLDQVQLGKVDDEINLLRLRLFRLSKVMAAVEAGKHTIENQPVIEATNEDFANGGEGSRSGFKTLRRLPDFDHLIDRFTGRIAALERVRAELLGTLTDPAKKLVVEVVGGFTDKDD